jgi:hypothetical protein
VTNGAPVHFRSSHRRDTKFGGPARSVTVADTGISVALLVSFPLAIWKGWVPLQRRVHAWRSPTPPSARCPTRSQRNATPPDMCIVVRAAAGASTSTSSYNVLPQPLSTFRAPPSSSTIRPSSRRENTYRVLWRATVANDR